MYKHRRVRDNSFMIIFLQRIVNMNIYCKHAQKAKTHVEGAR